MKKAFLIVAAILIVIMLIITYIRPPFVDKLQRNILGNCFDGGSEYYVDKNLAKDIPPGPIGISQLNKIAIAEKYTCGQFTTYFVIKDGLHEESSRWAFNSRIKSYNVTCGGCIISRMEGLI